MGRPLSFTPAVGAETIVRVNKPHVKTCHRHRTCEDKECDAEQEHTQFNTFAIEGGSWLQASY
jgi:hypothetical protein